MLPFFRKIRWRFAQNNQLFKYSRYALGEIVLVVIGILLALQINNWNENRKLKRNEQAILMDLRSEISSNILKLEGVISYHKKGLNDALKIQTFIHNPENLINVPDDSIFQWTFSLIGTNFTPEKGILNSILSSGQINHIDNKELKYLLASLNDTAVQKLSLSNKVYRDGQEYLFMIAYPESMRLSLQGVEFSYKTGMIQHLNIKHLFEVPEFVVAVTGTFVNNRRLAISFEHELQDIYQEILSLIDKEIKS